jgi:hypothetical protein
MLQRRVEPFTRSVGRLVDPSASYSRHEHKVKRPGLPSFTGSEMGYLRPGLAACFGGVPSTQPTDLLMTGYYGPIVPATVVIVVSRKGI